MVIRGNGHGRRDRAGRLAGVVWLLLCGGFAAAQIPVPGLARAVPPAEKLAQAGESNNEERFKQWGREAGDTLAAIEEAGANAVLPEGINTASAATRSRVLKQMVLGIRRYFTVQKSLSESQAALAQAKTLAADWAGFKEAPPYPIMLLDDLLNQRDASVEKKAAVQSSIQFYQRSLVQIEAMAAKEERELAEAVQAAGPDPDAAGKWRIDAERADRRLLTVRVALVQMQVLTLREQLETVRAEMALLDRKIEAVGNRVKLGDEELEAVTKAAADRQSAIRRELAALVKQQPMRQAARDRAKAALDKLEADLAAKRAAAKAAEEVDPGKAAEAKAALEADPAQAAEAERASAAATAADEAVRMRFEAEDARMESLPVVVEILESLEQLEEFLPEAYELRQAVLQAVDKVERKAAVEKLVEHRSRLESWLLVIEDRIREVAADLKRQEARFGAISTTDPRFLPMSDLLGAITERQAALQRVEQSVARQLQLSDRWVRDANPEKPADGWFGKIAEGAAMIGSWTRGIWNFEVMKVEDQVELDGQQLTVRRGVTLGVFIGAILFFVVAYLLASMASKRAQAALVRRGRVADAQARTLRSWMMILVGVLLALTTLHFLNIPLTVFAFLGGALAIGLGFGTQTLIKNFISGIILLFERKVRVGDIVDVGGLTGTVVEINTRSSVVRGFDGVEALIPNAEFLETRVVNWTLTNSKVRREVRVGVAYGTQPQVILDLLLEVANRHGLVLKDPPPLASFEEFGDNSLMFLLQFWIEVGGKANAVVVMSDLRLMIEKQLTEMGIGVPYPQRDIHLQTSEPLRVTMVGEAPAPGDLP